jgi:iron complex outermembrane receptor protein
VDYKLTEALTLTGGLRYTEELKAMDRVFGSCTTPANTSCTYLIPEGAPGSHALGRFEALTPSFTAAYRFNRNLNTYFRYAQGFKSGGFNGETDDPTEVQTPFKPEKQITFELGAKSSWLDNRAELNAALFQNNIRDLQESIFTAKGAAASEIRNAGQAIVRGLELEAAVTPVRGTRLSANYAYLDAHYNSFVDGGVQAKNDRAFVHAPRNTFNVVLDSRFLRTGWGTFEGVVDYAYTTGFFLYPYQLGNPDPAQGYNAGSQFADNTHVKGYGLLNLRLALTQIPVSDKVWGEVALWGRNVTNEAVAINKIDFGPGFGNMTPAYFNDPLTYGITVTAHF